MTKRRANPPLRVTERVDYAVKSVLLLSLNGNEFMTAKVVADHFGMSLKLLGGVLWGLRSAGIVDSRPGWHGGFRLARLPETIPLQEVIAAAGRDEGTATPFDGISVVEGDESVELPGDRAAGLVAHFWQVLDTQVQEALQAFTVADLAAARILP